MEYRCGHPNAADRRAALRSATTDARDAHVIADAARSMSRTLRRIDVGEDGLADPEALVGSDDDLAGEAIRLNSGIRGLFTQIHPAAERVLAPRTQLLRAAFPLRWPTGVRKLANGV